MTRDGAPGGVAHRIAAAFEDYANHADRLAAGAAAWFIAGDETRIQQASAARLDLHDQRVDEVVATLSTKAALRPSLWAEARRDYQQACAGARREIAATFFNSVTRRVFHTHGVDAATEILRPPVATGESPPVHSRPALSLSQALGGLLRAGPFGDHWVNPNRAGAAAAEGIRRRLSSLGLAHGADRVEVLHEPFFRGGVAYLVGALRIGAARIPLALGVDHGRRGLELVAALVGAEDLTVLFSYTRAPFLVVAPRPAALVGYLSRLMPRKPRAELYASIGFHKHGKTELYRDVMRHLEDTTERFERAPGVAGTVMIVFTMPGYLFVFKVIRDRFPPTKRATRQSVMDRYRLVFRHDRAGRLIDAHEFEHLRLPRDRFTPELLEELAGEAGRLVSVDDTAVTLHHVYVERRVTPLDLYIRKAHRYAATGAVVDYGRAIKNLAASNIFPGDMLLKNFGVTARGRVVFYDYDELMPLTDCVFRDLPPPRDEDDEMAAEPWYGVGDGDVFPEELRRFLGMPADLREAFLQYHDDLFGTDFWSRVQTRLRAGERIAIHPYKRSRRLVT